MLGWLAQCWGRHHPLADVHPSPLSLCHRYNWHLHAGGWQQQQSVCHVLWKIRERSKPCTSWEVCVNCLPNACECSSINGTYYASNYGIMYSSCWSNLDVVLRLKPAPPGTASRTAVCTARFGSPPFGSHGSILWLYAKIKSLSISLDTGECLWGGKCQADCKDTIDRTVVTAKGSVQSRGVSSHSIHTGVLFYWFNVSATGIHMLEAICEHSSQTDNLMSLA